MIKIYRITGSETFDKFKREFDLDQAEKHPEEMETVLLKANPTLTLDVMSSVLGEDDFDDNDE